MLDDLKPTYLLVSREPSLLRAIELVLAADGAHVEIALSAEAAIRALHRMASIELLFFDTRLPGIEDCDLLVRARDREALSQPAILAFSDAVTGLWSERLANGVIDDLLPAAFESDFLRLRIETIIRANRRARQLEQSQEAALHMAQTDELTGAFHRSTMLSLLFRETDRVQRMNTSLAAILMDVDDFGHWNSRLGPEACDRMLVEIVNRVTRLLRSYDLLGRVGSDEFLIALPGCTAADAIRLAERIRAEVFSAPFHLAGASVRVSACFAVAPSSGRSPVVVLRELEDALQRGKLSGPESILTASESAGTAPRPVAFLSPTSGDDLLAW